MELIVISESQIKLTLSGDEMKSYRGTTGEKLRGIIGEAERQYGIAPMSGRIYVQMYPSRAGGCELFVTRLRALPAPGAERSVTEYRRGGTIGRQVAYAFLRMDCLLGCCAALCRSGYPGSSSAYVDPGRRTFYLLLDRENPAPGEHLGSLCPSETVFYINEHCDALCAENAAEKLGPLA